MANDDIRRLRQEIQEIKKRQRELQRETATPAAPRPAPALPSRVPAPPEEAQLRAIAQEQRRERQERPRRERTTRVAPRTEPQLRRERTTRVAPRAEAEERPQPWRPPGEAAPIREEEEPLDLFASLYPWFDELGRQTPWWQPQWIPKLTGAEPMTNEDLWNFYMAAPRRTRRRLARQMWEALQRIRRRQ